MLASLLELSRELLGGVALGLFWIHTLLIAGAAGQDLRALGRLRRLPVRAGVVRAGRGPGGALACNRVEQTGRSKGDGIVHFNDAAHRSELFGGRVELDGGEAIELDPASAEVAVWPALERRAEAAALPSAEVLSEALKAARRARGWSRTVELSLGEGERVWLLGAGGAPRIIAAIDPRRWIAGKRRLILAFIGAELALAGACTALILRPPLFDWVSMLGAAAALGLFLGVQPVGVAVQDAVRTPERAYLRGRWGKR